MPLLVAAVSSFAFAFAAPHDPGLSSIRVSRTGATVHVHAAFANTDFQLAAAVDSDRDGVVSTIELENALPELRELASTRFSLQPTETVVRADLRAARIADNDDVELELEFTVSSDAELRLDVPLLQSLSRGHRCYCAFVAGETVVADALLRPTAHGFVLPRPDHGEASGFAQPWAFFVLGIEHILEGFDHLAFLLALLAAGVGWRRVVATITAFTIAHSITLLAAALGFVRLPSLLVEATIAASIVVVAAANLWQRGRATHRWPLALGFGLVHGFGFAGVLADLDIGGPDTLLPLLTFNVGVEVGQLAFALVAVPLLAMATRSPRGRAVPIAVSIAAGAAGAFWLFERLAGA